MATLADLRDALFPDAASVGSEAPGRDGVTVGWVRVLRARVPALDVLEAGDLVVVPAAALAVVAPTSEQRRDLAQTLAGARVAGALLVTPDERVVEGRERQADAGMAELAVALRDVSVPAYRVVRTEPGALERTVIGFLVDRRGEIERQAAELEGRLAQLALLGRGLDVLAAAIGAFLRRAVALEGRRGDAIVVHAPVNVPDAAAAVAAYVARPASAALRVPLPAPSGDAAPAGRLALLGERPVGDVERIVAERIAPLLALELARDAQVRQARDDARRGDPLPVDGPPWVVIVARQGSGGDVGAAATREETRHELGLRFPPRQMTLRGTSESLELRLVAAPGRDDPVGMGVAARVAEFLGRTVAVSGAFDEPGGRPGAEAAARAALEAAEQLPAPPRVVRADLVAAYRLLGNLRNLPDGRTQAQALVEQVLGGRAAIERDGLATLRAVLDHGGATEAAASLGVHRNTIAYRLRRFEERSGWDLSDPDLRLALSVAVRVLESVQTAQD